MSSLHVGGVRVHHPVDQFRKRRPRVSIHRDNTSGAAENVNTYRQILQSSTSGSRAGSWLRDGSLLVAVGISFVVAVAMRTHRDARIQSDSRTIDHVAIEMAPQ
jgi:hypothetical protein